MRLLYGLLLFSATAFSAGATVIYNNTTNYSGSVQLAGGASEIKGNDITNILSDEIFPSAAGVGTDITGFTFTLANLNSVTVTVQPVVSAWLPNGPNGGPGTLIGSLIFQATTLAADTYELYPFVSAGPLFPAPSEFYAGISFDNENGTLPITAAQLDNIGAPVFGPPTVGTSTDSYFQGSTAGQQDSSDPSGMLKNLGGNPMAAFGWEFQNTTPTPEPSSVWLLAGGLGFAMMLKKQPSR